MNGYGDMEWMMKMDFIEIFLILWENKKVLLY
jgi:hypothetical protein